MLATLLIESGLLLYVLWRYKMTVLVRLVATTLACLAVFQLAEFNVCEGLGMSARTWSRIGFVAITFLPPLGLHILHVLAGKRPSWLVFSAYMTAAIWIVLFMTSTWVFQATTCGGNYVIFELGPLTTKFYGLYYYGWLLAGMWFAALMAKGQKKNKRTYRAFVYMVIGYAVFLVPTATANVIKPESRAGIPSIMCGFAILLAVILVGTVLPLATKRQDLRKR
jgi:hypothetical protein